MLRKHFSLVVVFVGLSFLILFGSADARAATFVFDGDLIDVPCYMAGESSGIEDVLVYMDAHGFNPSAPDYFDTTDYEGHFEMNPVIDPNDSFLHYHIWINFQMTDIIVVQQDTHMGCMPPGSY